MFAAVINPRSGSAPADAETALRAALAERDGGGLACVEAVGDDGPPTAVARALACRPDALIVWGGDGTMACALQGCGPDGPPVLPLPGGTMNLFVKALYGDRDWRSVLQSALSGGVVRTVSGGRVADRMFFVALAAGPLTRLATSREAVRDGRVLDAAGAAAEAILETAASDFLVRLDGGPPQAASALGVMTPASGSATRALEVGLLTADNPLQAVDGVLRSFADTWRSMDTMQRLTASSIALTARGADVELCLDGEVFHPGPRARIDYVAEAARVIAPPADGAS